MDVGVERTFSPQNFSMFPWELVDDLRATKSKDVELIVSTISFQDFQPMSQTDRRTDRWRDSQMDRRHAIARSHFAL